MEHVYSAALFLHLLGFAAATGAGFAQGRFLRASASRSLEPAVRDAYERNAAGIVTKAELPALFLSLLSGLLMLGLRPSLLQLPGMHAKLTLVALLLVLAHVEMFNARRIVKARAAGGGGAEADIAARKIRQGTYGTIAFLLLLGILVVVAFFIRA
jgi:uncharacterized membrane protein